MAKPSPTEIILTREETDIYDAGGEAWDELRSEITRRARERGIRGTYTIETADGAAWDAVA